MYVEHIPHTDIAQSVDLLLCAWLVCEFKKSNVGVPVMSTKKLLISLCTRPRLGRSELLLPTFCRINIAILQSDAVPEGFTFQSVDS